MLRKFLFRAPQGICFVALVSRGGCSEWYRDISRRYVDLFDYYTPELFREKSEQRRTAGRQKPRPTSRCSRHSRP